jgi:hypothetical protein
MAEKTFVGEDLEYDFVLESGHKNGGTRPGYSTNSKRTLEYQAS